MTTQSKEEDPVPWAPHGWAQDQQGKSMLFLAGGCCGESEWLRQRVRDMYWDLDRTKKSLHNHHTAVVFVYVFWVSDAVLRLLGAYFLK